MISNDPLEDIKELLARAYNYDDKPHQLYSWILLLAIRYGDPDKVEEINRLMNQLYYAPPKTTNER